MTYKACVRARLVRHELTNSLGIRGQLEADGKTYSYETRSTIKDAVNRVYKAVNWTPVKYDEIILDGDFIQGHVIIDHIERWEPAAYQPLAAHKTLVDTLGKVLPEIPEFNRLIRHTHSMTTARPSASPDGKRQPVAGSAGTSSRQSSAQF